MTDDIRGGGPGGPPWSVDLLADLHAGVLDPAQSSRLWARVNADPSAKAVIDALDSVKVDLGELGDAPAPPMPADFAARLDAAVDAEARRAFGGGVAVRRQPLRTGPHTVAPVVDLAEARRKRGKRAAWGVGLLTAAAAAVGIGFAVLPGTTQTTGGVAAPVQTVAPTAASEAGQAPPLAITRADIGGAVAKVGNAREFGPLKDQAGLDKCLSANGLEPAKAQTIGVRPVTLDGKPGVMALLTTPDIGTFRVLVVQPDCTALFNDTIGR